MHQHAKNHRLGQALLAFGLLGLSATGCSEEPREVRRGNEQQTPYHIPVPESTVAVAAIARRGETRIIAVNKDGKADKPATCQLEGPDKCPFEFPEVVTTIRIGQVSHEKSAEVEGGYGVAFASSHVKDCIFAIAVDNLVNYYVKPCIP